MRRGSTTMKTIRSSSTTSTSGVMLIANCRLGPESSLSNCMSVSPRLWAGALGEQPHPAEAGLLEREHGLPDLAEVELCVPPDHDPWVLLVAHRSTEGFAEMLEC